MEIAIIPDDFIVSMTRKFENNGDKVESNFLVRGVRIRNDTSNCYQIKSIEFQSMFDGQVVQTISYNQDVLQKRINELKPLISPFNTNPDNELSMVGSRYFWRENQFIDSPTLESGRLTGFLQERIIVIYSEAIDALKIKVNYLEAGRVQSSENTFVVQGFEAKNQYIFPVKGSWRVINNWDEYPGHRTSVSQEFAIDLVQMDSQDLLPLDRENEYYPCYGKEVLSVAAGTVVKVFDSIPENLQAGVKLEFDIKERYRKYGIRSLTAGNYVIIDHDHEEYSFYAHLLKGKMGVQEGDHVTQGQVIGLIGNSGNSDAPHLHFSLLNSSELGASSLPAQFTNIRDTFGRNIKQVQQSFSTVITD